MQKRKQRDMKDIVKVNLAKLRDTNKIHPHVIVDEIDDKYVSVGLTSHPNKHKDKKHGGKNYKLSINPLGKEKISYMRRQGRVAKKNDYTNFKKGKMTKDDYSKAKLYGKIAKDKYLRKKQIQKNVL